MKNLIVVCLFYLNFPNSGEILLTMEDYVKLEDVKKLLITAETGTHLKSLILMYLNWVSFENFLQQEKTRGQRGRIQVQALGYVNSTKAIFGDISRTEVCFPRRPH